jgi:hypothetical protein
MVDKKIERKPFMHEPGYLSGLRKGAGRGWVVSYRVGSRYKAECKAHGTVETINTSAVDAKALVRAVSRWCAACERDAALFDKTIQRGELKFSLRSQTDPWEAALGLIDVPDSHPAFFVHYSSLEPFVPEGSGIKVLESKVMSVSGKPGRGERHVKRFRASVPIAEAQQAIVFLEAAIAHLSVIPANAAAEAVAGAAE